MQRYLREIFTCILCLIVLPLLALTPVADPEATPLPTDDRLDIIAATLEELQTLPGIGLKIAEWIMEQRPFVNLDDLLNVKGIGPRKLERLQDLVRPIPLRDSKAAHAVADDEEN